MPVILKSIESYVPDKIVTNADLAKIVDTDDQWIRERTGIKERRIAAKDEMLSDIAAKAAERAIEASGVNKEDIDCLILATCSVEQANPSSACITANKLGLVGIPAFDLNAMCSGFLYSLHVAKSLLLSKAHKNVLVIGAEKLSDIVDWEDRSTCILFGDGAGASILSLGDVSEGPELLDSIISSDGRYYKLLECTGKASDKEPSFITMQGKDIFKHAVRTMVDVSSELLKKLDISQEELSWLVPHQANIRILSKMAEKFNFEMDQVIVNLDRFGNTSAATIPIALKEGSVKFKKGELVLCPAFGGGLTSGAALLRW